MNAMKYNTTGNSGRDQIASRVKMLTADTIELGKYITAADRDTFILDIVKISQELSDDMRLPRNVVEPIVLSTINSLIRRMQDKPRIQFRVNISCMLPNIIVTGTKRCYAKFTVAQSDEDHVLEDSVL